MLQASMIRNALQHLGAVAALLLAGCRGREPAPGGALERDAAILAARTLGLAYLQKNQLAQAEASVRRIVALAPDQALGYANLGLVQLRQGRYREAETAIRRAAALDTANDDIALTLGKVYELTGRSAAARAEVDRVLRRSPHDLRALYALVQLDSASRESYLRQIVERAPVNVAARLELADLLLAHGAADPAAASSKRSSGSSPSCRARPPGSSSGPSRWRAPAALLPRPPPPRGSIASWKRPRPTRRVSRNCRARAVPPRRRGTRSSPSTPSSRRRRKTRARSRRRDDGVEGEDR